MINNATIYGDKLPVLSNPASANHILNGYNTINEAGEIINGTMTNNGSMSVEIMAGNTYTIPEGYHDGTGVISAISTTISKVVTMKANNWDAGYISVDLESSCSYITVSINNSDHITIARSSYAEAPYRINNDYGAVLVYKTDYYDVYALLSSNGQTLWLHNITGYSFTGTATIVGYL